MPDRALGELDLVGTTGSATAPPKTSLTLFYSCSVNCNNEPQVGRDVVSVLEKNGCAVRCPEQVCCGMPFLDGGDIESARKNVESLEAAAARGEKIVVPQPTCSYVLKNDYPPGRRREDPVSGGIRVRLLERREDGGRSVPEVPRERRNEGGAWRSSGFGEDGGRQPPLSRRVRSQHCDPERIAPRP